MPLNINRKLQKEQERCKKIALDKLIPARYNPPILNIYASFTTGWRVKGIRD